eukprot:COSAG01_NODE_239_length_20670_cov_28.609790_6_plen_149_part_00
MRGGTIDGGVRCIICVQASNTPIHRRRPRVRSARFVCAIESPWLVNGGHGASLSPSHSCPLAAAPASPRCLKVAPSRNALPPRSSAGSTRTASVVGGGGGGGGGGAVDSAFINRHNIQWRAARPPTYSSSVDCVHQAHQYINTLPLIS